MAARIDVVRTIGLTKFEVAYPTELQFIIPVYLPGKQFEAEAASGSSAGKKLPVEESIRPIWISDAYSNASITSQVYQPFFGTSAITDQIPARKFSVPSVEEAVDRLVIDYSKAVQAGGISPLDWVHSYTERDIARYGEVLGSKTLKLENGVAKYEERPSGGFTDEKYKYYGGFHSNAVNYGDSSYGSKLEFLDIKNTNLRHRNTTNEEPFTLTGAEGDRLDPRADRAKRVLKYKSSINGAAALGPLKTDGIGKRG
jgi:hypothetical protein